MNPFSNPAVPTRRSAIPLLALTVATALLAGCSDPPEEPAAEVATGTLTGTAATGAALANANVSVTNTAGASVCAEATVTTTGTGGFTCTLTAGSSAPFLVLVTDPSGAHAPLVSAVTSTPAAGTPLVVNATPLTTAILASLAADGSAAGLAANLATVTPAALSAATSTVLTQLQPVLAAVGVPVGYDPFETPIVAATANGAGNTADAVIDLLRFSTVNGVATVTTVDQPDSPVALPKFGDTAPPAALPAPATGVVSLANALRVATQGFNDCFALPVNSRVLATDTTLAAADGGPEVTTLATACQGLARSDYLHNGYRFGQALYALLNDSAMVGATFSPPEVMLFVGDTTPAGNDRAVLGVRYRDANGVAGSLITVAQRFPGSATGGRATDWWLFGNQQPVESYVQALVERIDQLAPNAGTAPFAFAPRSTFATGFDIYINKDGPASTGLRAARVTGPGLPTAGLVFSQPPLATRGSQSWLNIAAKNGNTDPAVVAESSAGNLFRLQRTQATTGAGATQVRPNPNAGTGNNGELTWAHPLDYGLPAGSEGYIDFATLKAHASYTIELFYAGETQARHTLTKRLLQPVVPATRGIALAWHTLDAPTLKYLDPADARAAATGSVALAWNVNVLAESVRSVAVYTGSAGSLVNQGVVGVARGASSAQALAPQGSQFPALSADGNSYRNLQLRYRRLDGSSKFSFTRYN